GPSPSSTVSISLKMNLLSSNERFATGGDTHSSMGVPLAPNPLKRSSVRRFKSVVGASVIVWEPETEFGSVARKVSAPTAKSITTTSFSDFIDFPPVTWAKRGPIEKKGCFSFIRGRPEFRGTLLTRGVAHNDLVNLSAGHTHIHQASNVVRPTCLYERSGNVLL